MAGNTTSKLPRDALSSSDFLRFRGVASELFGGGLTRISVLSYFHDWTGNEGTLGWKSDWKWKRIIIISGVSFGTLSFAVEIGEVIIS